MRVEGEKLTVADGYQEFKARLETVCSNYADKTAITYMRENGSKENFTFGQIYKNVQQAGNKFEQIGLYPGDIAAVISPLSPYSFITILSLAYANITTVLIDATLPIEEICRLLANSDVRAVFTVPNIYVALEEAAVETPVFDLSLGSMAYQLFIGSAEHAERPSMIAPDFDVIAIMYSSGTTASMKGVMVTYAATLQSVKNICCAANITDKSKFLLVLPINHIAGFNSGFAFFDAGAEIGMLESSDISAKLQNGFHMYNPTHFVIVPKGYEVMIQKIKNEIREKGTIISHTVFLLLSLFGFIRKRTGLNPGKVILKSIRHQIFGNRISMLGSGANICSADVAEFFLNLGIDGWANFYASTETNVPAACTGIFDRYPAGTEGRVGYFKGIDVKICDADENGIGEIRVKSVLIMKGYFREPELTTRAFDKNGYFKTGDLGYIDKKGYLHVTGRSKESILLQTGKKVAPFDVESLYGRLCPHAAIAACGVPDRNGVFDEIHLFIEKSGLTENAQQELQDAVMDFSAQTSTLYKIAKVHFIDKFPITSVGKVKRYLLKELAVQNRGKQSLEVDGRRDGKNSETTQTVIWNIAARIAETVPHELTSESRLREDLGLDSLSMVELCFEIESALGVEIADYMGGVTTLGSLLALVNGGTVQSVGGMKYDIKDYPLPKTARHIRTLKRYMALSRFFWRFEVSGLENVPKDRNFILAPNHQSMLDALWIWAALGEEQIDLSKICCLAAEMFLNSKFHLAMLGGIPVERSGNTVPALKRGLACVRKGYTMLVHPEGTRSRDGKLHEFKGGAAKLAIDAGVVVIPVRIDGAWDIFPPHRKFPRLLNWRKLRRYPIHISFGEAVSPDGKTVEELTTLLYERVKQMKQEEWPL